jgi:hypothetical protein
MIDLMTQPEVIVDESCCLTWLRYDGTRSACPHIVRWEIQRNGESMALTCSQDLERVLALVYSYEPDAAVLLHVIPIDDIRVHATVPTITGGPTATAILRPMPVGCGLQERGNVTRDDDPHHATPLWS